MIGIGSAATAVLIGHVAGGTATIRVGAGGIMLPNHSPLVIAEQFGTLESLFPGRIDLGLGRAPGTGPAAARALRRNLEGGEDSFPEDVAGASRLLPARPTGPVGPRRPRCRPRRAGLDPRLEPLRRACRRRVRAAVRVRFAFRAGDAPWRLSRPIARTSVPPVRSNDRTR